MRASRWLWLVVASFGIVVLQLAIVNNLSIAGVSHSS